MNTFENIKSVLKKKSFGDIILHAIFGFAILIGAHIIGKIVGHIIYNLGQKNLPISKSQESKASKKQDDKTDIILVIISKFAYYIVMTFAVITIFHRLGVETASIIALVGTVGIGIGLALQGTFTDVASGIILAFNRTYKIGEIIKVQDAEGTVLDFTLINTTLKGGDGSTITIPNRKITEGIVINQTRQKQRVITFQILISNKNPDFTKVRDIIVTAIEDYPGVIHDIDPVIGIASLESGGSIVKVKVSIDTKEYPKIALMLLAHIRDQLLSNGIILIDPEGTRSNM